MTWPRSSPFSSTDAPWRARSRGVRTSYNPDHDLRDGSLECARRVLAMVARMDEEGFGNCTWHGECQAACPKAISIDTIARMNGDWLRASVLSRKRSHDEPNEAT